MKESLNFLIYIKEIQILTEFHLKITMNGDDIAKKVILPQIWSIFGPSSAQILSTITKLKESLNFMIYNVEI